MEWDRIIIYLALSLEQQEEDQFKTWILAQQDPKKFRWRYRGSAHDPLTPEQLGARVQQLVTEKFGARPRKGDVWHYARAKGLSPVIKKVVDGKEIFVNEEGQEIERPQGSFFIPSRHPDAERLAEKMREA